jgi:hypothetical protein
MPATIPINCRLVSGSDDTPWLSNFGIKPPGTRGDFDASLRLAIHSTSFKSRCRMTKTARAKVDLLSPKRLSRI